MNVHVIRADGTEQHAQATFREIHELIGAELFDTVDLRDGRVMVVDDNGWETEVVEHGLGRIELKPVRARKPINTKATAIYHGVCRPGTKHQIVGDVAIVVDCEMAA